MSQTAATTELTAPALGGRHHFLLHRLHSLTGILFGLFLALHLFVNATLSQGSNPDVYQLQIAKVHSIPFLWVFQWLLIYLPILFHIAYGSWMTFNGRPNVGQYPFGRNYLYLLQRISAMILILFILFHVLSLKGLLGERLAFDPDRARATIFRHINAHAWIAYLVYPIGILAACFHLAYGFWTAAITWGLTITAGSQLRWAIVCAAMFAFTLLCGFLALGAAIHHG